MDQAQVKKNVQPMELTGNLKKIQLGECIEVMPNKFLVYQKADDTVLLGKLDFGNRPPEPILAACRKDVSTASTLGFIYSGSMEALTLAAEQRSSSTAVAEWFNRYHPELRFSIWWY